jgi:hypothetical protein
MSARFRFLCRAGLLALSLLLAGSMLAADATVDTWVRILPSGGTFQEGDQIAVEVRIEDVVGLYGADVHLTFDVDHLTVLDANPSLPGVQVTSSDALLSPDLVIRNEADNQAGTVWYAVTQMNPSLPVTGTGVLFSLSFQTLSAGDAPVDIYYEKLATINGTEIPASSAGAMYQIEGPSRCFLPLVLSGP